MSPGAMFDQCYATLPDELSIQRDAAIDEAGHG
jgi:hypothetical protein